jgi:2-polyprenyl-3-methyl-5-hydroxy-6-metoxy-1,4-benzoquinol methylase
MEIEVTENLVENYGWERSDGPESCGYITPRILEILKDLRVKSVVDIGAGNGALCGQLAGSGYSTVGIEYDKSGVAVARANHPLVRFYNLGVQDSVSEVLANEQLFDAAVSTEVVEHLFSPHLLPIFAANLLRPNGYLIVTTPYHGYLKNLALSLLGKWDSHHTVLWHGGHIKFWSRATLTSLLEANGFAVIGFSGVGRASWLWKSMILVAQKR